MQTLKDSTAGMYANDPRRWPKEWEAFCKLAPKVGLKIVREQPGTWLPSWNWYLAGLTKAGMGGVDATGT